MRRCLASIVRCAMVMVLITLTMKPTPTGAQTKANPKKIAVLIGVNGYANQPFNKLEFAERDMLELEKALRAAGFKVILLLGSATGEAEASRENITAVLLNKDEDNKRDAFRDLTEPNDVILVAFSGRGETIETFEYDADGKLEHHEVPFFCPKTAKAGTPSTQVNLNEILRRLNRSKAKSLLLVDACRSDAGKRDGIRGAVIDHKQIRLLREDIVAMFACSDRQQSLEHKDAGGGHGLFFAGVLKALQNSPKDRDGNIHWDNMVPVIRDQVSTQVKKLFPALPERDRQQPQASGTFTDKVILVPPGTIFTEPKAGEERDFEIAKGVKMRFCWIPAGKATLGSPKMDKPRQDEFELEFAIEHEFTTRGFWLGKYEVTQGEWKAVMGNNPSHFSKTGDGKQDVGGMAPERFPVENVRWLDCQEFFKRCTLRWLRVPHEDEWEYAARGGKGNKTAYYWGDDQDSARANWNDTRAHGTALGRTSAVGSYQKAAPHPWGLCDMVGNVSEYCDSDEKKPVLRSGNFLLPPSCGRLAMRFPEIESGSPGFKLLDFKFTHTVGFRVCLD